MLPPVPFPNPVVQAGVPFVSFQDPRASVFAGPQVADGAALVEPPYGAEVTVGSSREKAYRPADAGSTSTEPSGASGPANTLARGS